MSKYHNTYQRIYQEKYRFLDTVTQPYQNELEMPTNAQKGKTTVALVMPKTILLKTTRSGTFQKVLLRV